MGARGTALLSPRALNRALLGRQLLLGRVDLGVAEAIEHLFGLNAQDPDLAYFALWNRLERFEIQDLTVAIERGVLVRSTMMRATQHLMSAADFRLVRPALAPLLRRVQRNAFGSRTTGVDLGELVADTAELLEGSGVLTRPELGRALARTRLLRHGRADVVAFERAVTRLPEIRYCHHITGNYDYLLHIEVADLPAYEHFHAHSLAGLPSVAAVTSYITMKTLTPGPPESRVIET
ncbi:DNA glycosylase AlkZ-like family protein [Amycolatopsis alba]|uniref:Transcription regulator AsnC/Lrp ligand binding domain-containing protein n=1 Tax=Amycolatopsis alba DSM 44262 TaxID=1125972 RepID=A0A229RB31_AMYAL|nr:crosslink repair DNA glycosylase YcaQ family protein [Amycolatopsis alba]OXM43860.1 hypothetical protein CFP75_36710 [Amycolatopsis alba DSM 44262]